MAIHQSLPGRRSMLKVDKSRTKSHHGFPRALRQPRMCCLSFGLLLFLCWGQGVGATPSPCPSMCRCYTVDTSSTNCVVDCTNANISSITDIPSVDLPSSSCRVVQLNLSRNSINSITAKSSVLQNLPYLEVLDLSYNDFTALLSSSFSSIIKIKYLNLSHNSINHIDANTFHSMSSLITLDLSYNRFTEVDATTFKYTTNLQALSLAGNLITKFKDKSFEVPLLTTLDLSDNPVKSFERLMFTSSSSITTLYINKMNLTSLPPHLFTNLMLLENLYLRGNNISFIPDDAFSSNPNLTVLDASSNQIESLEVETFYGLTSMRYLDISNNKLVFLNASMFRDMHTSLTSLNVAFNDWVCECSMKPFIEYLVTFNNSAGNTLVNWQNTTCTGQPSQNLLSLNSQFLCATDYFSCYNDTGTGTVSTVMYATVVPSTTATSQQICKEECFKQSSTYAGYDSSFCLCGNSSSDYNCGCSTATHADMESVSCTDSTGSSVSKTYLANVSTTSIGIILNPIPPLTAGQSYTFTVNVTMDIINMFMFSFGDSSNVISEGVTGNTFTISYTYPVPAQYTLDVSGCYTSGSSTACESVSVPILVHPPDTQVSVTLSASSYEGSISTASVTASFTMGQGLDIYWSKSPNDGVTCNTSYACEISWTAVHGRCIQVSGSVANYDTAKTQCTNSLLNTIQHSTEVTEFATEITTAVPSVTSVYIEAKKNGSFYTWADNSYTYFTVDDVTNSTVGDCVMINLVTKALEGAVCSDSYNYVCQKPPNNACPYGGVYYPTTRNCYVAQTGSPVNWSDASTSCQAITSGASLATFDSAQLVSHVTSTVLAANTEAWVGLRYQNMEGYLEWVNSESVWAYTPTFSTTTGDCFSLSQTGAWKGYPCSTALSYICQYSVVKDTVTVEASGVGTMNLNPTSHAYSLSALSNSSTPSAALGIVTIFPGHSISTPDESATVVAWNFKTANLTTSQIVAFQVWRPECKAGETFVTPVCNGNGAKYGSCKSTATTCPSVQTCTGGTKYCFHDDSCKPVADVCDCTGCTESYVGSSPTYRLIDQTFVVIPTGAFQYYTVLAGEIESQSNDIIAYQTDTGSDVIQCDTGGDWAQNTQQSTVSSWLSVGDTFNVTAWKNNTMCYFHAIYSKPESKTMPSSIGYFTTTGPTEFQLSVPDPVITKTKIVTSQEMLGSLVWLWPSLQVGQTTDTIFVESGTSVDLLLVTNFGTDLTANWTFGSSSISTTFSSSCPNSVAATVCEPYTNWPALPFTTTSYTFTSDMDVYVDVSNQVSSANLTIAVRVFEVISGVSIALTTSQTNNYVAYNEQTSFTVTLGTGTPTVYEYNVNGTKKYTANVNSFSHNFLNTSVPYHVVTVNASDDYSHALAEIGVTVKVRANFQNFQFTNVPSVLRRNTLYEYGASVDATVGAEVSVMWIFGVGPPQLVTSTIASSTQQFNLNSTYSQTGSYTVAIFLQDDSFLSAKYISSPIDVVVVITSVTLSTSSDVILEGDSITFTPSLPGPSYYGRTIYYTYDFQDGTTLVNQTSSSATHVFSTLSSATYSVNVIAMNGISSGSTSVDVTVEQEITSLSLTGTSPILINTTKPYTASVVTGSHITYSFQEATLGLASDYTSDDTYNLTIPTVGVYNLTVIANNTFATLSESLEVRAVDSDTLQILSFAHDRYVVTASSVVFKLDVLSFDPTTLHCVWAFGDGANDTGTGLTETSHSFANANNYTVTVTLVHNATGVQRIQSSSIGVQDTVTDLQVNTNGIGNIVSGAAATVVLTASVATGTDVWYTYTYDGSSFSTSNTTYELVYSTATMLPVDVVAANQISSQNITISVTFQETIESLIINCSECIVDGGVTYRATNATSNYTASVGLGTDVSYTFSVAGQADSFTNPLSQVFSTNGNVFVNVTASNKVSSAEYSLPVVVEDTITSLKFDPSITKGILVNSSLTMDTIIVGSHVSYSWKMCSTCSVITTTSGSYVNPGYTASGSYIITVVGGNHVSTSATATLTLTVHEPITNVDITSNDLVSGTYVPIDTSTRFTATANIALHVYFDWTIYNSTGSTVETLFNTDTLAYNFTTEGEFIVKVTAINSASSMETNLTVIVETPISGVVISNNNTSPIATNAGLALTATVNKGSTLTYSWNKNDTAQSVTSADFAIAISPSGTYVFSVVVTNPLGSVTETVTYVVLDVIENASIIIPNNLVYYPFVAVNSAVQFSASVPKGDEITIAWDMKQSGVVSATGSAAAFDYTFASVANYTLTMNVTNDVSSMVKTTDISIQTPLTSLSMTASSSAAETNALVTFTGVPNSDADHLTFEWTIDSTTNTTTTNTTTHTFTVARNYVASVNVSNQISTYSTSISVEIEDPIQGLSIQNCNATVNVTDFAQALAVITQGTNVTYSWSVDVDSSTIQQTGKTFGYSFTQTAVYNLDLNVSNLVSSDVASCWFTVIGPISDVVIVMSDDIYLFVNYTVEFTVTGNNLVGVIYDWSISPINYNTSTETGALSKMFTVEQSYVVMLTVSNNINSVSVTKSFYIDELTCPTPIITAGGETSKIAYKANSIMFDVYINRFTCTSYDLQYQWTAYNMTSCAEDLANPVTFTDIVDTTPKLLLTNGTLNYGQFCIVLVASYRSTPLEQTVKFNVTVLKTELVAVIAGGNSIQIPANTEYRLDGSSSYDKDLTSSLTYNWSCTKVSGSAASNACTSLVSGSSSSVNIPASDLIDGQMYDVTLTVSATDRTSGYYTQRLTVGSSDVPSVEIVCVSCLANYLNVISSAKQVALQGSCTNCGSATVSYQWTAVYVDSGTQTTFSLTSASTYTGDTNSNLVVKKGQIVDGKPYTFRLSVTKTENSVSTTSYAELELLANMPPSGTGCTVANSTINVFSMLSVDCQGFSDPDSSSTELLYEVVAYSTDSASDGQFVVIYSGPKSQVDVYLTSWSGVSRTTVQVKVFVLDSFGGVFEGLDQMITVIVSAPNGQTMAEYLWDKVNGEMLGLVKENSPTLLLQYAITMIHEVNELSRVATTDTEKYIRASLRNILALTVLGLPLEDSVAMQQAAFFMDHLTVYPDEFQTSACQDLVLILTQSLKSIMENGVRQGLEQSTVLTNHLLRAVANAMTAVNMAVYSSSTSLVSGWFNDTMQMYIPSVSNLTNVFSSSSLSGQTHRQFIVTKALSQAEDIIGLNLKSMLLGQGPLIYNMNSMAVYGVRTTSDNLNLDYVGADSSITVSSDTLAGRIAAGTEVFQIYINSDSSLFTWGYNADFTVDTKMASLTLKDASGADISIDGLSDADSVKVVLNGEGENINITNASIVGNTGYDQTKNLKYVHKTVNSDTPQLITLVPSSGVDGSALYIQVSASNIDGASLEALATPSLASFYLGVDIANPTESDNSQAIHLVASDTLPSDHRDHTFYISNFDSSKTYRISLYVNDTYMLNVSSAVYMGSCMYYDTQELAWSTSGCQPTSECIAIALVCKCNHLTAFGGGMLVPIDAISFSDLEFIDLYTNPVVFVTSAIILVVYIVAAIISRRLDLRDLERISSVPLCGKDGSFKYEITVVTGKQRGAGTSAHVGIKLYGEYGKSNRKHLSKKGAFQRNCQDSFIIAHDTNLGDISKVFVWHDNHGLDPSWYMVQVIVRNLQTDQKYYFFGNIWLTLEKEHGFIQKEIYAAGSAEIQQFTRIFGHAWSSSVSDRHLWMSVMDRPANSRFTRVQRATCIVTILYVFMCINIIWYGVIKTTDTNLNTTSFGWQEVVVALATNAVVFPFSILLISIFKKSRSKNNLFEQGIRTGTAETIEIDNNCDQSMYSSFQTNDDLISYLGERESTSESILASAAAPRQSLALRRTRTLKTSLKIEKVPSSADSFNSSVNGDKNDRKLERTNNPGRWEQGTFKESWQKRLKTRSSTEEPQPSTSGHVKQDRAAARAEVEDAADDIMEYLDMVEADIINKEQTRKNKDTNQLTPGLSRKPPVHHSTSMDESKHSSKDKNRNIEPKKGGLKRKDSTHSVGISAVSSNSYAIPSSSGTQRNFTPREEPSLSDKKPTSAGSVAKWVSKLKPGIRSNDMPSVEHTNMSGTQPLRPNSLLARQISQPDIITHSVVGSFTMEGSDIRKKKSGCTLPPWCVYVGYFLCFCLSVLSVIVVMLYGYQLGAEIALQWVLALLFSVTFSFFMFETIKALFMALYIAGVEKKVDPYDENDVIDIEPVIDNAVETVKVSLLMFLMKLSRKPTSAGSVAKWVSKLKPGIRSNDMPSVEHTNMSGTQPLRPNSLLARQISQPDIITHSVVGSFTMEGSDIRKKKSGCTLPPWCVYVGYFLCFCLSVLSVIVVMLYGYQLGAEIALQWVLALLFSVTFSFFMFETIKALFMALYIAGVEKKVDPYDENDVIDIEPVIDNAVETVKEMKFKPLAGFSLVKAREEGQKVQRMRLMLRQFVAYMFYLWLLMVLCYVNFNSSQYYFTYSTENQFIRTTVSNNDSFSFQNMTSIEEFWVWSQAVLSPGLHWEEIDNNTEYGTVLGTARLRQVRSLTEKCMAYDSLIVLGSADFLSGKTCVGSGGFDEDQNSYGETWSTNQAQNLSWNYYTSDLTGSKWQQGNVFSYSGGGYVQFLGTNYTETLSILQDLQAKDWINLHTRAVFVEFTLYNPATDLTTHVNLLVELPLTGSMNTSYVIHSQKLLRYINDIVDPMMVCEGILFVVVVYLWIHMALLMRDEGCSFFTSVWNMYELLTTLMAMAVIGLYVGCVVQATSTFDEFLANSSSFVNFETTIDIHLSMRYIQAWLLFLLMFKIVKQLRFIKILYIYERTLSESAGKLFGVALIFAILFLTHGMLAYLWYGPYVGGFESYWHTLTTLLGAIRGTFDFWLLFENSRIFSHFFFISFYIFVYGLTICFIVAILSDTYKTLRSQMFFKSTLDMQDHEMIDFTLKRFKMWAGITKPKPEFRAVRFPGLPSVSSRCTSRSSTRSFSEASVSSDGLSMLSTGGSANAAARLSSTWLEVLHTMDRVTHLDGIEENLIKKCQKEVDEWKWQNRISNMEKENDGLLNWTTKKPPATPNTRTTKIPKRVSTQPRLTAKSEGMAKTPPTKPVVKGKATPRVSRPLSDQGGRAAQRSEQPGTSQDRMSVFDFFKSIKPSKPAW
ncbi:LOW QUALITY PROTEIN: polycystin-1-like [Pecten maximus]|uniref:LOW QUALITY PROTEIN: polycystin-1-like n=1 Tax=Pecten maximus TaxID=6579 RepID=UPI0014584DD1|nr:LOW QUALITY PROTEIN: polycystin-1-like [Pecten maximus]